MIDAYVVMPNLLHGMVMIGAADTGLTGGTGTVGGGGEDAHSGAPLPGGEVVPVNRIRPPVGADPRVCPATIPPQPNDFTILPSTLGLIIQWFKTMSTNDYIRGVNDSNSPRFNGRLWQRN